MMRNWKSLLLVLGILLLVTAFLAYLWQVSSCYPTTQVWQKFTAEQMRSFRQVCNLNAPAQIRFALFLGLLIPGILLFTAYWLLLPPQVKVRRGTLLGAFLILMMIDSLLLATFSLLSYPLPGQEPAPAIWAIEVVAGLGFLSYLSALAIWRWKRWGVPLFQGAAVALAVLVLMGGGSRLLAAFLILGVIALVLLLRPVRHKMT